MISFIIIGMLSCDHHNNDIQPIEIVDGNNENIFGNIQATIEMIVDNDEMISHMNTCINEMKEKMMDLSQPRKIISMIRGTLDLHIVKRMSQRINKPQTTNNQVDYTLNDMRYIDNKVRIIINRAVIAIFSLQNNAMAEINRIINESEEAVENGADDSIEIVDVHKGMRLIKESISRSITDTINDMNTAIKNVLDSSIVHHDVISSMINDVKRIVSVHIAYDDSDDQQE